MRYVCATILVGMVCPVLKTILASNLAKFPFQTMDYSPWSSKNLIDRNRLKEFMQVGVDVTCMYADFGGRDLSGFIDTDTLRNGQISPSDHGL